MTEWRYALRRLRQSPGFALIAIASMALGLAANTTVFTMVNTMHLRPVAYPDGDRLVALGETSATQLCAGCAVGTSRATFRDWESRTTTYRGLAAYREDRAALSGKEVPQRIAATSVTANLFDVLGLAPIVGRTFTAGDAAASIDEVILAHDLWQRVFGGETSILGRTVRVNGRPHVIIGVMPPGMRFPGLSDVWLRLAASSADADRSARDVGVIGRLAPGVSLAQADGELRALAAALGREHPALGGWSAEVITLQTARSRDEGNVFLALLCAVGVVLLIVCVNLAGLMLARAARSERDMAIRSALGARAGQLAGQVLRESLIVSIVGGALGLLASLWFIDLAVAGIHEPLPSHVQFTLDWRVFLFCAGASMAAALGFGLLPAQLASRPRLQESLKQGGATVTGGGRSSHRLRNAFLVAEMALSIALLANAALLIKTAGRLAAPPPSLDLVNLVTAEVALLDARYRDPSAVRTQATRVVAAIDGRPGARGAVSGFTFIAGFGGTERQVVVEGRTVLPPGASPRFAFSVSPGYFDVLRLPVRAGRRFSDTDRHGTALVALVNEQLARGLWPDGSALGRRVKLGSGPDEPWRTIVGIVGNESEPVRRGQPPPPFVYVPFDQVPVAEMTLRVRTTDAPGALVRALPAILTRVDADQPVEHIRLAQDEHEQRFWFVRWTGQLFGCFAGLAVLLSAIGVYGAVSHLVSDRLREFGIRVALGARAVDLQRIVLGQGTRLALWALLIGIPLAAAAATALQAMLFGTSPLDPGVYAGVSLALTAVVLLACWRPGRRAARVDPLIVLREG